MPTTNHRTLLRGSRRHTLPSGSIFVRQQTLAGAARRPVFLFAGLLNMQAGLPVERIHPASIEVVKETLCLDLLADNGTPATCCGCEPGDFALSSLLKAPVWRLEAQNFPMFIRGTTIASPSADRAWYIVCGVIPEEPAHDLQSEAMYDFSGGACTAVRDVREQARGAAPDGVLGLPLLNVGGRMMALRSTLAPQALQGLRLVHDILAKPDENWTPTDHAIIHHMKSRPQTTAAGAIRAAFSDPQYRKFLIALGRTGTRAGSRVQLHDETAIAKIESRSASIVQRLYAES